MLFALAPRRVLFAAVLVPLLSCACASTRQGAEPPGALYSEEVLTLAQRREEVAGKTARVVSYLQQRRSRSIVGASPEWLSWLTAGAAWDGPNERMPSPIRVIVRDDGSKFVVGLEGDVRRLCEEELAALGFSAKPVSPADFSSLVDRLDAATTEMLDGALAESYERSPEVAALRIPLTDTELRKYRWLGRRSAEAVEEICLGLQPFATEKGIERLVSDALRRRAIQPVRIFVSADGRLEKYGLAPSGEKNKVERQVMIGITARRWGLHASLSRIVRFGPLDEASRLNLRAAARITAGIWARTVPNARVAAVVDGAFLDYAELGRAPEMPLPLFGGATGYREYEWLDRPWLPEVIRTGQAFAWRASVGGITLMDTVMLAGEDFEVLTETRDWPRIEAKALGRIYRLPSILVRK